MSTKRANRYFRIGLIPGILICVFGCANLADNFNTKNPTEKLPIRTLSIQIDEDQREELLAQLRKFSEKHALEFYLAFYNNKETFSVFMEGKGISIAVVSFVNTLELNFRFFEKDPTNPPSQETVDEVFNDLKTFISEIPNVTITDEK
ncbi:MAG: hypothetical protein ABIU05_27785 [Nitrospirales bacterium]